MKRTISKLLGIAALAIAGIAGSLVAVTPAHAVVMESNASQNGIACVLRYNGAYPDNLNYYYCGDPALPINVATHKKSYSDTIQALPASVKTALDLQQVKLYVFCTAKESEIYFGALIPFPAGTNYRTVTSYFLAAPKRIVIFQYLINNGQSCATPTSTIDPATHKFAIYSNSPGYTRHEVGHFVDQFMGVPNYKHSLNDTVNGLWRRYLQKDIDWINLPSHVRCQGGWFTDPTRDMFSPTSGPNAGTAQPICNGTVIDYRLATRSNFQIMEVMINLSYHVKRYVEPTGVAGVPETWKELFPEEFANNHGSGTPNAAVNYYIKTATFFPCSKAYAKAIATTGLPPVPAAVPNGCAL